MKNNEFFFLILAILNFLLTFFTSIKQEVIKLYDKKFLVKQPFFLNINHNTTLNTLSFKY